jgi:hypothetical protein
MTISLEGRIALRELMAQAWQRVEGQAREMLKRSIEGLLQAERDRRVSEAKRRGEKVYRWGYTVRKCWTTLWGSLEQVRVPRLRGREEIGLVERYERHGLDQMLFALTVGGLSQREVVGWVRRFLGGRCPRPPSERYWSKRNSRSSSGEAKRLRRGAIGPSWWTGFTCAIGEAFRSQDAKACCWWQWACGKAGTSRCWTGVRLRRKPPKAMKSCLHDYGSAGRRRWN